MSPCGESGQRVADIKNVVFDMGGVLMDWDPERISRVLSDDPEDAALVAHAVFDSREWGWIDAGALSEDALAWVAKMRVPERLHDVVDRFVYHWDDAFDPLPEMGELVRELKADGYGVYLLSNAGRSFVRYRARIPAIDCMDGIVVSCYEHVVKPDAAIYQLLCERYGLEIGGCLFVDDMERNVVGARRAGMQGYTYDGDVDALRSYIYG